MEDNEFRQLHEYLWGCSSAVERSLGCESLRVRSPSTPHIFSFMLEEVHAIFYVEEKHFAADKMKEKTMNIF